MKILLPDMLGTWRPCDEPVDLTFEGTVGEPPPSCLHWRGSLWRVVGHSRHWSTWHALPVAPARADDLPTTRGFTTDFWRFQAQTSPVSPVLCFEVRRALCGWRLVRLGATFDVPEQDGQGGGMAADGTTLAL